VEESDNGHDRTPRHDTPSGPITGNRVVPSPWQKTAQNGPMIMAGDTAGKRDAAKDALRVALAAAESHRLLHQIQRTIRAAKEGGLADISGAGGCTQTSDRPTQGGNKVRLWEMPHP
jgi:hypothetical protein